MIDTIQRYKMPIIRLDRKNSREAICLVFEKLNVGGMKLDAFELLTAIYAASTLELREDWHGGNGRLHRMIGKDNPRRIKAHQEHGLSPGVHHPAHPAEAAGQGGSGRQRSRPAAD